MPAFKTLEFAENDINSSPQQEDGIKQFLKVTSSGNNRTVDKLQQSQSTLTQVTTDSILLPVSLISALRQRVVNSELLFQQYFDKIEEMKVRQTELGIALNTTNQTSAQTEELLKEFSGQGCLSFPQWKQES
jgi:hypothetical protein